MNYQTFNPLTLDSVDLKLRNTLPEITAIYFLVLNRKIVYIGKAKNLKSRWFNNSHHTLSKLATDENARIYYLPVNRLDNLEELESFYINIYNPLWNVLKPIRNTWIIKEDNTTLVIREVLHRIEHSEIFHAIEKGDISINKRYPESVAVVTSVDENNRITINHNSDCSLLFIGDNRRFYRVLDTFIKPFNPIEVLDDDMNEILDNIFQNI